jgi:hypothetical protein
MNYKPFDLEAAKRGEPVITRDGRSVRVLCTDRTHSEYPIIALITSHNTGVEFELSEQFTLEGSYRADKYQCEQDLFMAPVVREYWVNVYSSRGEERGVYAGSYQYTSKEAAEIEGRRSANYLSTVLLHKEES